MDIPNWRAIILQINLPPQIKLVEIENEPEFDKVTEAWRTHYPACSARRIAEMIGVKIKKTQSYISQLNATQGNVSFAKLRLTLYCTRTRLRESMRNVFIPEVLEELRACDKKLTKAIDDLKVRKPSDLNAPIIGQNFFERTAKLDKQEPGLTAAQVAKRLGSTPDTIGNIRSWLRKAKGDHVLADHLRKEDAKERQAKAKEKKKSQAEGLASGIDG